MFLILIVFVQLIHGFKMNKIFVEQPEDIETIIGSTVILRCRTQISEPSQVTWCKNDFCTLGKSRHLTYYPRYEIIGDANKGEHDFRIVNVSLEDIGVYQCQVRIHSQTSGSMSRKAKISVLQMPTSLSMDGPIILQENVLSSIVCRSTDGMPEAKLTWILPDSLRYISKSDYVIVTEKSLRNSISNITLIPRRFHHGLKVQCRADSPAITISNKTFVVEQSIKTTYAPQISLTLEGEQIESNIVTINCLIDSRPDLIDIEWFNGSSSLNLTNKSRISLLLTRFMHKNQIFCQARNEIGKENRSIILDIIYKPVFVDEYGNQLNSSSTVLVDEGKSAQLECLTHSSPPSTISWMYNNELIAVNKTSIQIDSVEPPRNIGLYHCLAHHRLFGVFNRTIRLALKGPPEIIDDRTIISSLVGQSTKLICSISKDPPVDDISWLREDQIKISSNEKYHLNEQRTDRFVQLSLSINNLSLSDQGVYLCRSMNQFGSSTKTFNLKVNRSQIYLNHRFILYGSIISGCCLFICLLILSLVIYFRRQKHFNQSDNERRKPKIHDDKSRTHTNQITDENILHQKLIQDSETSDQLIPYSNKFFHSTNNQKSFSTVV